MIAKNSLVTEAKEYLNGDLEEIWARHIDKRRPEHELIKGLRGKDFIVGCENLLSLLMAEIKTISVDLKDICFSIVIPLGETESITTWSESFIEDLKIEREEPSIYIVDKNTYFHTLSEEYRIDLSVGSRYGSMFRSMRDQRAIENNWEYTNGIYLYTCGSAPC